MKPKQYILIFLVLLTLFLLDYKIAIAQDKPLPVAPEAPIIATTTPVIKKDALFEKIAFCESRNNPRAKNPYSSASGRFQFIWGTWHHYGLELWGDSFYTKNIWDYVDNTELALYVYKKYGTKDWLASKSCWGKV